MQNMEHTNETAPDTPGLGEAPHDDSQAQMPLNVLMGGDEALGIPGLEPESKGVPAMALVLVVILAVGGGAIWAMRLSGNASQEKDEAVASAETKIDEALKKLAAVGKDAAKLNRDNIESLFQDADKVVAMFADDPVKNQIELGELNKNPFELLIGKGEGQEASPEAADFQRQERVRKLREELAKLRLQSVLSGANSLAVISGQVVRQGDTVGAFTVEAITPQSVILKAEGESFDLTLNAPNLQSK